MVVEVEEEVPDEQAGGCVRDPPAAKLRRGMRACRCAMRPDPLATSKGHDAGGLAAHFDDEAAVLVGLPSDRATSLARVSASRAETAAINGSTSSWEASAVMNSTSAAFALRTMKPSPTSATVKAGAWPGPLPAAARAEGARGERATPARMRSRPSIALSAICSARTTTP